VKEVEAAWQLALMAKADAEGELASLQAQVGGVSDVVEKAKDEAARARGRQHERVKMFRALTQRAHAALSIFSSERLEDPLEDDDAGYLNFFTKLVKRLEDGAARMDDIIVAECRDLLSYAAMRVFSNLFRADTNFDFDRVMSPVPVELHDGIEKEVRDHVEALVHKFSHGSESSGEVGNGGDDDDGGGGCASSA
jgi:hypothetical protein